MADHDFDDPLDEFALEWIRFRFTTEGNSVTVFTVQYETTLAGERVPVVRYDSAHGFAHRDVLDRDGAVIEKVVLGEGVTFADALSIGQQDIRTNWRAYRTAFFREKR
jgi:hypothetical protein